MKDFFFGNKNKKKPEQEEEEEPKSKGTYEDFIKYQISLNLDIETSIFQETHFKEKFIEEKFQQYAKERNRIQKIFSDIVIIIGYLASLVYIILAYYKTEIFIICCVCKSFSIFFIILSYKNYNNKKIFKLCEHLNTLSLVTSLFLKCFIVCFVYNTPENDNESELLRIIIYYFVSTNIFLFMKFEANLIYFLIYLGFNVFMIILASVKSNRNHYFFLEGLTSFLLTFIFWGFRKVYDFLLRKNYAEAFKFENFYNYAIDFIKGLNSFHVNFDDECIKFIDPKFEEILCSIDKNYKIFDGNSNNNISNNNDYNSNENLNSNKKSKFKSLYKNNLIKESSKNEMSLVVNKTLEKDKFLNNSSVLLNDLHNENYKFILQHDFTKQLTPFKDVYSTNENQNNFLLRKSLQNIINGYEIYEISKSSNEEGESNNVSLYSILQIIKKSNNLGVCKTFRNSSDLNNFVKLGIFNFKNEEIKKYFEVFFRRVDLKFSDSKKKLNHSYPNVYMKSFEYDLLFYDVSELILSKKTIYEENIIKQKILAKLAHEFKTPINSILGLIDHVKENLQNNEFVNNKSSKSNMTNEFVFNTTNNNNQNSNANANNNNYYNNNNNEELNSEKFVIFKSYKSGNTILNQNNNNNYEYSIKTTEKNRRKNDKLLNIIENLSKYVIFLISDIVQYSNMKDITQINVNFEKIQVKETATFVFEILKCLLKCNKAKKKSVKAELFIDDSLRNKSFKSDEIRIKQILLNIISNAVKFTKHGKIKLFFDFNSQKNEMRITIEDSGIGIKEEDKPKLFNDFVMLEEGLFQNPQGSGLGLSICKSLAFKLNLKLDFESEYGKGSKFYVYLPLEDECYYYRKNSNADEMNNNTSKLNVLEKEYKIMSSNLNYENDSNIKIFHDQDALDANEDIKNSHFKKFPCLNSKKTFAGNHTELVDKSEIRGKINLCVNEDTYKDEKLHCTMDIRRPKSINYLSIPYLNKQNLKRENSWRDRSYGANGENFKPTTFFSFDENVVMNIDESQMITRRVSDKIIKLLAHKSLVKRGSGTYETDIYSSRFFDRQENSFPLLDSKGKQAEITKRGLSSNRNSKYNTSAYNMKKSFKTLYSSNEKISNVHFPSSNKNKIRNKSSNKNNRNISTKYINANIKELAYESNTQLNIDSISVLEKKRIKKIKEVKKKYKKILIIDDNEFINDSIKSVIENIIQEYHMDFQVVQGSDGVDLLKSIIEDQKHGNMIECVFTDENMEYMNGSDAIRIIRNWEKENKIKNINIFSVSGQEDIQTSKIILGSGANNVLGKPISKSIIINCFRDIKLL